MTCLCRKNAWHPDCPLHGRRLRLIAPALFYCLLPIAVAVTTGGSP